MTTEVSKQLCALCGTEPVDYNGYICKGCLAKAQYQEKANLVLEGSEQYEWGLVKLTPGTINHVPAESELVGTWHRYGTGTYWVSLVMDAKTLSDRATLLHAEVDRRRVENLPLLGKVKERRAPGARRKKEAPEVEESKVSEGMQALRDRLRPKT